MTGRSADTNLAEIHEQMNELLDPIECTKRELKIKLWASSRKPTKKCVMKMKEEKMAATSKNLYF